MSAKKSVGVASDPEPKRQSANRKKETVLRLLRGEPVEAAQVLLVLGRR